MWTDHEKTERKIWGILGLHRLSSLQTYGENLNMEKLHDRDIREPLFEFLEETYGRIRILEEKTMGKSRADIVMVTPEYLYGIEIKSDADTYARLARQVKDYDRILYYRLRCSTLSGLTYLPGRLGGKITVGGYRMARKIYQFQ